MFLDKIRKFWIIGVGALKLSRYQGVFVPWIEKIISSYSIYFLFPKVFVENCENFEGGLGPLLQGSVHLLLLNDKQLFSRTLEELLWPV